MAPLQASAQLPTIYAGLVGGYTAATGDSEVDPLGPALGARAGLTIPTTDLYVGGLFLYHFGETFSEGAFELSTSSMMIGGEVGYELGIGPLVVRPSLGLGLLQSSADIEGSVGAFDANLSAEDSSDFYISPGVAAMISLGVLVGAEVRYNAVVNEDVPDGISILGTIGLSI